MTQSLDPSGDQWEIRQLIERYAEAADHADGAAVAALFVADGVLEVWLDPGSQDPTNIRRGTKEIEEAVNWIARYRATHHSISGSVATVDGDRARGETRCVAHHVETPDNGGHDRVLYIRYLDEFARIDARWRFSRRELRLQWVAIHPVESI